MPFKFEDLQDLYDEEVKRNPKAYENLPAFEEERAKKMSCRILGLRIFRFTTMIFYSRLASPCSLSISSSRRRPTMSIFTTIRMPTMRPIGIICDLQRTG